MGGGVLHKVAMTGAKSCCWPPVPHIIKLSLLAHFNESDTIGPCINARLRPKHLVFRLLTHPSQYVDLAFLRRLDPH